MKVKSAVLREFNKPVTIEELELADPKANEVMVKVVATGFCHSDVHVLLGEIPVPLPMVLGHETAGIVHKVGPGVTRVKEGDRVVCSWMVPCGKCDWCLKGHGNLCQGNFGPFLSGYLLDNTSRLTDKAGKEVRQAFFISGFSTYTVCPEGGLIKIPDGIKTEDACFMGCCIPTGYGSVVYSAQAKGTDSIAVWGMGGVGLYAIRGAAMINAYPIIAVDLEASKEKLAREFGATHFVDSSKDDPVKKIMELTGTGVDVAIECIGDPGAQIQAYWSITPAGQVILPGITPGDSTTNFPMMLTSFHEKKLIGCLYGGIKPTFDIPRLFGMQSRGLFKVDKLVSKKMKLEDINSATESMLKREIMGRWIIMMD